MPPFAVQTCTVDDGPAVARNCVPAFWGDSNWVLLWPGKTCEYVTSQAALRWSHNLLKDPDHRRNLQAVDQSTGEVVGLIRYVLPDGSSPDLWSNAKVPAVSEERAAEVRKSFDAADWDFSNHMDGLDDPMNEFKERLMQGKRYLLLDYLAVHPSHQGRGIASMLVQHGAEEADKMGLDTFVLAFKAGLNVYKRAGFKLLDQIIQDDSKYGGSGEYGAYFLERKAESIQ